jgi:HlyD family secretion protein
MKRQAGIAVVLLALAGAGAWWFDAAVLLGLEPEESGTATLYGNVDIRQVELGFRVGGRIAGLEVEEGDRISAGTAVARLDPRPYEDALKAASARVAEQEANLARLVAGTRPAEIAQARAFVAEREADLANAEQAFERGTRLVRTGTAAQAEFDRTKAEREMARARLQSARLALELAIEGARAEDVAAARAALEGARANEAAAMSALEDAVIEAPSDGTVLSRVREAGAIVQPTDTVLILSLDDPVRVRAYVAEPLLGRVAPGLEVEILTDSAPERPYRGRIGFVSPVAEFTPKTVETPELRTDLVYGLRITVEDADEGLRQGMPVTIRLPLPSRPPARGAPP